MLKVIGLTFLVWLCIMLLMGVWRAKNPTENDISVQTGHTLVQYLGGSPYLSTTSSGAIKPKENGLSYAPKGVKAVFVNWSNIKSVETKTHEQITSDVTAGRILLLGVFALAAKKQTIHRSEYLVVHCNEEGVDYDMIFSGNNTGSLASQINRALIQHRKSNMSFSMEQAGV